ncbi:P-loop NTPase fold protein [Kurthia zopfii]|uniref:P-loop NTPase fold protein n=1 Tax=Kurthia zopfii TaxID=1650 RepID=UPI000F6F76F4|nr:P-loop NTPase fold protein [Kurthia zopfii]VEI06072.1 KAP family P-loop domain [Kurthia zopfii]
MSKVVLKGIKRYLDTPNTNYAIQIDGEWGSGKTYFLLVNLKELIEKSELNYCYISLNGVSDVSEIKKKLFSELSFLMKGKTVAAKTLGLAKIVTDITSGFYPTEKLSELFEKTGDYVTGNITPEIIGKTVFIFDDLERIGDDWSYKELFGFINTTFLEMNNIKIIVVSNEKEIADSDYKKIKEKVIGRRLNFENMDLKSALNEFSLVYNHNEFFNMWFLEHNEYILELFNDLRLNNLRTIRTILDYLYVLLEELKDEEVFLSDNCSKKIEIINNFFLNILVIVNELSKDDKIFKVNLRTMNNWKVPMFLKNPEDEEPNQYLIALAEENHRKNIIFDGIVYQNSILDFIKNNFITDMSYFTHEINVFLNIKYPPKGVDSIYEHIIRLEDYRYEEFKDVEELISTLEKELEESLLKVNDYIRLRDLLNLLDEELLLDVKVIKSIVFNKYKESLTEVSDYTKLRYIDLPLNSQDKEVQVMVDELQKHTEALTKSTQHETLIKWIESLINKDDSDTNSTKDIKYSLENSFFKVSIEIDVIKNYFEKYNSVIARYVDFINQRYLRVVNASDYGKKEIPYVEEMLQSLENIEKFKDPIQEQNIKMLIEKLKALIPHLNK